MNIDQIVYIKGNIVLFIDKTKVKIHLWMITNIIFEFITNLHPLWIPSLKLTNFTWIKVSLYFLFICFLSFVTKINFCLINEIKIEVINTEFGPIYM